MPGGNFADAKINEHSRAFLLHFLIVGGSTVFFVGPGLGSASDL